MSSIYKVRITRNELTGFNRARLQISVGQPYHEGEKFLATVKWVADNFDDISINMCDTLQRHNLVYLGYTPFQAFDEAIQAGNEWLERNTQALSLVKNASMTRWEDWKKNSEWPECWKKTLNLYEDDESFIDLVDKGAELFWDRRKGKEGYPEGRKPDFIYASKQYILEEVAVSMIMSSNDIAEIYPGSFPIPLYYLRDKKIPAPLSMTSIAFTKKKQFLKEAA